MGLIATWKIDFVPDIVKRLWAQPRAPIRRDGRASPQTGSQHRSARAAHNRSNLRVRCLPIGLTRAQIAGRFRELAKSHCGRDLVRNLP